MDASITETIKIPYTPFNYQIMTLKKRDYIDDQRTAMTLEQVIWKRLLGLATYKI